MVDGQLELEDCQHSLEIARKLFQDNMILSTNNIGVIPLEVDNSNQV